MSLIHKKDLKVKNCTQTRAAWCMSTTIPLKNHNLRKKHIFNGNYQKSRERQMCQIKNHVVSDRAKLRLSSHAFTSVFIFLTKIHFFEREGET